MTEEIKFKQPVDWLRDLAQRQQSDAADERFMRIMLERMGLVSAQVTCGLVYPAGWGRSLSIHQFAAFILKKVGK